MDAEHMGADLESVLFTEEQIQQRLRELGAQVWADYADKDVLLVGVLKGAVLVMADLMRTLPGSVEMDWMAVSSYGSGTKSSGVVRILKDLGQEIEDRRIIVVEDIVDSGLTLQYLLEMLQQREPRDIKVVAMVKKDKPDAIDVQVDRVGFVVPDEFVVGYGLDYAGRYRNLPYIGVLDPSVYSSPDEDRAEVDER